MFLLIHLQTLILIHIVLLLAFLFVFFIGLLNLGFRIDSSRIMSQSDRFTVVYKSFIFETRNLQDSLWWPNPTNITGYYSSPGLKSLSVLCSYNILIFLEFIVTNCHCFQAQCVLCEVETKFFYVVAGKLSSVSRS